MCELINSIFYIGSLHPNSNSWRRFNTYKQLVAKVEGLDIDNYIYKYFTRKFDHHINFGLGTLKLNWALRGIDFTTYEVILIDNRPFVFKSTLKAIQRQYPLLKIALVLTDDPNGKYRSGWRLLKQTVPVFDIIFVQRWQNISELQSWGARNVEICLRSYDPSFHRKKKGVKKNNDFDAGFVGSYEAQRAESVKFLIENGIKVQVIGDGWENGSHFEIIRPYYVGPSVYGEQYVDYINSMKIALHFLRHANRDEQDSRTFEIPACGTPMIAEYSSLHALLFKENEEVLFFKNNSELLEKVKFFIENEVLADEFAKNASLRCVVSGYGHVSTLQSVLRKIQEIVKI